MPYPLDGKHLPCPLRGGGGDSYHILWVENSCHIPWVENTCHIEGGRLLPYPLGEKLLPYPLGGTLSQLGANSCRIPCMENSHHIPWWETLAISPWVEHSHNIPWGQTLAISLGWNTLTISFGGKFATSLGGTLTISWGGGKGGDSCHIPCMENSHHIPWGETLAISLGQNTPTISRLGGGGREGTLAISFGQNTLNIFLGGRIWLSKQAGIFELHQACTQNLKFLLKMTVVGLPTAAGTALQVLPHEHVVMENCCVWRKSGICVETFSSRH